MKKSVLAFLLLLTVFTLVGCERNDNFDNNWQTELPDSSSIRQELFIPELIDMTTDQSTYEITVDESEYEFFEGYSTDTMSYNNQGYLGKTIKVRNGNTFFPVITNNLDENTTVHWHGLEVNGENDGAAMMSSLLAPGETKPFELAINQHASTIWYHPHAHGYTASQVYSGLAGLMIIEDEYTDSLNLPKDYGVNDIPLILQAKLFDSEGNLDFGIDGDHTHMIPEFEDPAGDSSETTDGFAIMTNGSYNPYLEVTNGVIRFRVLNGSNHGVMDLSLSDASPVYVIATDGGFLEEARETGVVEVVASQRYEILIDLTDKSVGDEVELISNGQVVLTLQITAQDNLVNTIPNELVTITPFEEYENQEVTHVFNLDNDLINDTPFDHMTINYEFNMNQVYYFEVRNRSRENHSFHVHSAQFLVVEIDGVEVDYRKIGWKDTIYLEPGESMILQVKFKNTGDFMIHCHILLHEEEGMMHKFRVVD